MITAKSSVVRRAAALLASTFWLLVGSLALAPSASAEVPEGWPVADEIDKLTMLLVLGGLPILLFVAIAVAVYLPAMMRGERVAPGAPTVEDQWLGGPRKSAGELAAPDSTTSEAGGASGRW